MMAYTTGNLLDLACEGKFQVIVQGCNCFCRMGSGIAKEIRERFPMAYQADQRTIPGDRSKLGTYTVGLGKSFNVINAYTQYSTNKPGEFQDLFEYESFQKILTTLSMEYNTADFGFPLIGCGLAGGNRDLIVGMIEEFSYSLTGTVTLVEFNDTLPILPYKVIASTSKAKSDWCREHFGIPYRSTSIWNIDTVHAKDRYGLSQFAFKNEKDASHFALAQGIEP